MRAEKGSFAAPLFFLSLLFACAGSRLGSVWPWALSAAALLAAGLQGVERRRWLSWLCVPIFGYSLLVAVSALFASPAYTPAGLYHPLLLALGFVAARRFDDRELLHTAIAVLAFGGILAVWGLVQIGPMGTARAHALFETPATYAAVVNLLLVPVLVAAVLGRRSAWLLAAGCLFAAAAFAADSRGGLLGLAAGLGGGVILGIRARMSTPRGVALALAILAAGWVLASGMRTLGVLGPVAARIEAPPTVAEQAASSQSRLELYALSWNAWLEKPVSGTGYLTFGHALERGRTQVPSYGDSQETSFVHNDYLQTLQELGPIGLLALLGLTVLPPILAYRRLPGLADTDRPIVVASAAALAAMSVHALVDFPFYIPVCLLLYGALLGAFERRYGRPDPAATPAWVPMPWHRPVRTGFLAIAIVILLRPIFAEAAAEWGLRRSAAGDGPRAAFWLGAAQRVDPRDWRYHWYAGQFWDAQAIDSGKREAARLAAEAYAAGFAANPLEVRNLLGMISVNRRHRDLLDSPADDKTLRDWMARAAALAPLSPAVRRELAR